MLGGEGPFYSTISRGGPFYSTMDGPYKPTIMVGPNPSSSGNNTSTMVGPTLPIVVFHKIYKIYGKMSKIYKIDKIGGECPIYVLFSHK